MGETRYNKICIVACCRRPLQRSSGQDVVPGKGDEHRVLDVVIQRVAVTDAFQRDLGRKRKRFTQADMRGAKPDFHFCGQKRS